MFWPTKYYPIMPGTILCLLFGYVYVTCVMGVAFKNLSVKSDFSQTFSSRSGFDSERGAFSTDLNLNEFNEI